MNDETIYRFIGDGRGVPGLPHVLTGADVARLGVETLLADALKNKTYEAIKPKKPETAKTRSTQEDPTKEA